MPTLRYAFKQFLPRPKTQWPLVWQAAAAATSWLVEVHIADSAPLGSWILSAWWWCRQRRRHGRSSRSISTYPVTKSTSTASASTIAHAVHAHHHGLLHLHHHHHLLLHHVHVRTVAASKAGTASEGGVEGGHLGQTGHSTRHHWESRGRDLIIDSGWRRGNRLQSLRVQHKVVQCRELHSSASARHSQDPQCNSHPPI